MEDIKQKIQLTNIWKRTMDYYKNHSTKTYINHVKGQCKNRVSNLSAEINPEILVPAHPIGYSREFSYHAYSIVKSNDNNPRQDIIVDLTIGQLIPDLAPFIGTRDQVKLTLDKAYIDNRINPEFMDYFNKIVDKKNIENNATSLFHAYYGDNSLNALTNEPIDIARNKPHVFSL